MNGLMKTAPLWLLKKRERGQKDGAVLWALPSTKGKKRRIKVDDEKWGSHSHA